jgi:hypothetical protein
VFTLEEVHELLTGFAPGTPARERWKQLSTRKLVQLAAKMSEIRFMQSLLKRMMKNCHCDTLETCGKEYFTKLAVSKIRLSRSVEQHASPKFEDSESIG